MFPNSRSAKPLATTLPSHVFPVPYQVDFSVESKGRHLDSTKRRIKWTFGFANPPTVFPHLYDEDENYYGGDDTTDINNTSHSERSDTARSYKGVECRGREHEIILTWSLLTGKAKLWLDNKEIYRHEPPVDSIFNPFNASFHKGFDLPNPEFNGSHHIDIRCYARTPMGAKNMQVDDRGGTFRQYELTVDGLSYFAMPAMFELGTERMWSKVSNWGLAQRELDDRMDDRERVGQIRNSRADADAGRTGRLVDEYYFAKGKKTHYYDQTISKGEKKRMTPRSESEEERMMRIAMEASMVDYSNQNSSYEGSLEKREHQHHTHRSRSRTSSGENDSSSSNKQHDIRLSKSEDANRLKSVQEDENLIDFGTDHSNNLAEAVSQINISRQATSSDVSVLGDDDATTASFMVNTGWKTANNAPPGGLSYSPMGQIYQQQTPLQPHFHDPTYNAQPQPWNSGSFNPAPSPAVTPRGLYSSDASFAVPPPPTWDDYNNAFGGASMYGGSIVSPMPVMSPNNVTNVAPVQYGGASQYSTNQWHAHPYVTPVVGAGGTPMPPSSASQPAIAGKNSKFDPLRDDPFAS